LRLRQNRHASTCCFLGGGASLELPAASDPLADRPEPAAAVFCRGLRLADVDVSSSGEEETVGEFIFTSGEKGEVAKEVFSTSIGSDERWL
jgi:hypothetical protein